MIKAKLHKSQLQRIAELKKANNALLQNAERDGRDLNQAEGATFDANMDEIQLLMTSTDRYIAQQNVERGAARQPVSRANNPGASVDFEEADRPKFATLGDQLVAIARCEQTRGSNRDPRLVMVGSQEALKLTAASLITTGMSENQAMAAAAGMNEGVPAEGGFLVQTDVASDLLQKVYDTGELLNLCQPINVSSGANRLAINGIDESSRANGSRFGGVQAFWSNEAATITATKPKFRRIELTLNKLMAVTFATDEMLADAAVMESVINNSFPLEFSFRIEDAMVNGTGAGMPMGILNHPALVTVLKEAAQAANTVVAQNIMKMWSRCWSRSRKNAVWMIDQSIEPQLFQMQLPTAAGISVPIYLPPGGLSASPYGTLFGRPVIPTEYNASLTNLGDIILSDFSQYTLARKSVLQAASSMHVNFLSDEMAFRFTYRLDGQPSWNTALTPKNGGPTLSPFVTLQAR